MKASRLLSTFGVLILAGESMAADIGYTPPNGFIPDATTAVGVAEIVLMPIYGRDQILRQKPLVAVREGNSWIVTGTMKPGDVGGVATIVIDKRTGGILRVTHGK